MIEDASSIVFFFIIFISIAIFKREDREKIVFGLCEAVFAASTPRREFLWCCDFF